MARTLRQVAERSSLTPILSLFRQHRAIFLQAEQYPSDDDDHLRLLFWEPAERLAERIKKTPSTCAADMAAKMLVAHGYGEHSEVPETDPVWREALSLVGLSA